jgi:hypothetical protein
MGAVMPFMPFISAASTIFGVVSGAMARSESGRAQQDAANYNAAVAMQNAQAARDAAAADADTQRRLNASRLGKLTTGILKQGVELEGTPLLLLDEEVGQGALEVAKIQQKGAINAANYTNQANQQTFAGQQARSSADTMAGSTLLTGLVGAGGTLTDQLTRSNNNYRPVR